MAAPTIDLVAEICGSSGRVGGLELGRSKRHRHVESGRNAHDALDVIPPRHVASEPRAKRIQQKLDLDGVKVDPRSRCRKLQLVHRLFDAEENFRAKRAQMQRERHEPGALALAEHDFPELALERTLELDVDSDAAHTASSAHHDGTKIAGVGDGTYETLGPRRHAIRIRRQRHLGTAEAREQATRAGAAGGELPLARDDRLLDAATFFWPEMRGVGANA